MTTTQLDGSLGLKAETTYGTAVTVDTFYEFLPDSKLAWDPTFVQGQGLRAGSRVARSARRVKGKEQTTLDLSMEASSKQLGAILQAAFGTVANNQRSTTGVYQQNHTPIATDYLKSYTIQNGVPLLGGDAIKAHTITSAVCASIEFDAANSDILQVKTSWIGKEVDTDTDYATPSYATSPELFTFAEGAITIGGTVTMPTTSSLATGGTSVANIRDVNVKWDNALDDGGFNLGGAGKRSRKPAVGMSAVSGSMTAEFDGTTLRDAYLDQDDLALVLTFTGLTTIGTGSDKPGLQIVIPNIRLEGELPNAGSGDVITQSIDFTGFDDLTNDPIIVCYVTDDTAP